MKTFKALVKTKAKLDFLTKKLEIELHDKIDFKFSIIHQPSDGWCILREYVADLSPLCSCIKIIEQKGILSIEDFDKLGI